MTDIRRTLLWVVFSMSLVLIWDAWQKHNGNPSMFSPAPAPTVASAPATGTGAGSLPAPANIGASGVAAAGAAPAAAAVAVPSEKVVVNTDLLQVTIDSNGATISHAELLAQVDPHDPKKHVVLFDNSPDRLYLAQTGLIPTTAGVQLPNHTTAMTRVAGDTTLQDGKDELKVSFESPDVGGVKLVKTYTFKRGEYVVGVKHEVVNTSAAAITPQLYLRLVRDGNAPPGESSFYSTFTGPAMYTDNSKFHKIDFKSIEKGNAEHDKTANNGWIGMVQHYFATAWLLDGNQEREFRTMKEGNNLYSISMVVPLGTIEAGKSKDVGARLFVGPQEENKLSALVPGLELVKDYGYFKVLAEPLFWLLTQLHKLIGNWGWSIVALVVVLKAAFYWLNAYAYRSMGKMKAVNPRIMELRERLKDKPQQLQQEMLKIYKDEGVNPIGGCLPILVQMPFFIALYWVLLSSVEMRNAPWIGWITDLSAKDPFFILPLLMTATSLLQTWLNPTPPDPVQAKMMWIMPLVFSVMFFFFPAGLVLYWLTNNILSIAQQYLINRQLGLNK
ncbi:membrane protein insertase YidC [Piscinibacter gummiphilus]|uniref:Membrane protein insertase YidC n=1 Tax=Piscinibacter gummiphilus TaxID=946333 RepID=A0A1W6LH92_9BURK|nr:membrane protein insertase YidC [Piscinibacter gummiphilus]ARN23652.1 membrane protein insertase YidC [Piscinibacter gummiphilus]ATU68359.1 membrane protein insertase YidC [Piscinibacter gummiphilus]GLS98257.1 membrane protein insertase YidC [Piscinibacter gummiphilus]